MKMSLRGKEKGFEKPKGGGFGFLLALIYLAEDNDSGEACVRIIWNGWMEDEDPYYFISSWKKAIIYFNQFFSFSFFLSLFSSSLPYSI